DPDHLHPRGSVRDRVLQAPACDGLQRAPRSAGASRRDRDLRVHALEDAATDAALPASGDVGAVARPRLARAGHHRCGLVACHEAAAGRDLRKHPRSERVTTTLYSVESARARFSSLREGGFAFFDAPGGTQVPDEVGEAIVAALRDASGNLGAPYATGRAVEAILARAKDDGGRFLGCTPEEISFGMNMTTLNFALSRAAARDFDAGDEVLTTELDHDGGVAPWVELAADKGLVVRIAKATDELTVDYDDLERQLTGRTRVVAFALASNATGTVA